MSHQIRFPLVVTLLLAASALACSLADLSSFLPISNRGTEQTTRGAEPFSLNVPNVGLDRLTSYRATLRNEFVGTIDKESAQWSKAFYLAMIQKPIVRLLTIVTTGALSSRTITSGEIAGVFYRRDGDKACGAEVIETPGDSTAIAEPARLLPRLLGGEEVPARESLQGVTVKHYRFDERAIGAGAPTRAAGEVWIASEGEFVVKYSLRAEGGESLFGKGIQGSMTWEYELGGVNQVFVVEPPEGCPPGLVDAPRLPDATEVVSRPGLLTFKTGSDLNSAVAFYEKQLPAAGWQASEQKLVTENLASLEYMQGERRLSLVITSKGGITTVRILLERR